MVKSGSRAGNPPSKRNCNTSQSLKPTRKISREEAVEVYLSTAPMVNCGAVLDSILVDCAFHTLQGT